jgi:tetratricopeptide (TPR) repeat protein
VFSWSYRALTPPAARLFRLLGLHPGPDITAPAAASLAALPLTQTRPLLAELRRAHLLTEHTPGRYTLHDLLRTYTAELTHEHDGETGRRAARHRLLDHYLHTGHTAAILLNPHREPITIATPRPGVTLGHIVAHVQAQAWFDAEQAVLLAIAAQAPAGFDTHTWQIAWSISDFLYRRGQWTDVVATQRAAVEAAGRAGNPAGQARAHRYLAMGLARLGEYEDALRQLRHALDLYRGEGEVTGQAHTYIGIARINDQCGKHTEALHHCEQALDLFVRAGNEPGQAEALNAIGWCHARLGNYERTIHYVQQSLTRFELPAEMANNLLPDAWDSLGYAHQQLGRHASAIGCYQHAIDLYRRAGARRCEADSLARLGDAHLSAGQPQAARTAWQQALDIFDESALRQADEIRAKLKALSR